MSDAANQATRRYAVGDPDPTPVQGGYCRASDPVGTGYVCTWPRTLAHGQHVAGAWGAVIAVWEAAASDDLLRETLAITCPKCGAEPGKHCRTLTANRSTDVHRARFEAHAAATDDAPGVDK